MKKEKANKNIKETEKKPDYFEDVEDEFITPPSQDEVLTELNKRINRHVAEDPIDFDEWKRVISDRFPDLLIPAEIGLSVIAQLLIKDITNPFGLVYVDVPSSGKTIVLNFFSLIKDFIYSTDNFTAASFVSHATNRARESLKSIDILPKVVYKTLIIRDLAPLFGQRDDDLLKSMGLLTRIFDGEGLETTSGVHGKRSYQGKYLFMFLAASTPIQPRIWKLMSTLGSRLFFLSVRSKNKSEEVLASQLMGISHKQNEKDCSIATARLLKGLIASGSIDWLRHEEDKEIVKRIAKISKVLAKLRGLIDVWGNRLLGSEDTENLDHKTPSIEMPDRINQLLYNLARGLALIQGRKKINKSDLEMVTRVALDSAPTERVLIFRELLEGQFYRLTSSEIQKVLKCSRPTALKNMRALHVLDLVEMYKEPTGEKGIRLRDEYNWLKEPEKSENHKLFEA